MDKNKNTPPLSPRKSNRTPRPLFEPRDSRRPGYKWYVALFVVLLAELLLAQFDLSRIGLARSLAEAMQVVFPVVSNFMAQGAAGEMAGTYIAVTFLGFPVLVAWAFMWADTHRDEMRSNIAITPLSKNAGWFRRIFFMSIFAAFVVGVCWYVFDFGNEFFTSGMNALRSQIWKYKMVLNGGWTMWFSWVLLHQFLAATGIGGFAWLITEWYRYFFVRSPGHAGLEGK